MLRVERWHSSEGRTEIHFFLPGTQTYVFGFNPELIDERLIVPLIESGMLLKKGRKDERSAIRPEVKSAL